MTDTAYSDETAAHGSACPECGADPTDESIVYSRLSDVGYLHTDTKYKCANCGEQWIVGEPDGTPDGDAWTCDSCGGEYVPHFLYIAANDKTMQVRPKCRDCYHVPNERITLDSRFSGENIRGFVGHPAVTGEKLDEFPL